jgi:hypothetical protein
MDVQGERSVNFSVSGRKILGRPETKKRPDSRLLSGIFLFDPFYALGRTGGRLEKIIAFERYVKDR